MLLDTATRSLVITLGENQTSAPFAVSCAFEDTIQLKVTPTQQETAITDTADHTVVNSPANNTARSIKEIILMNGDTVTHNVVLSLKDGGTKYMLWKGAITAGKMVQYSQGYGFFVGP